MKKLVEPYRSLLILAVIISAIGLLGWMEKKDNDVSEKYYCQMVHESIQPDYNGTYEQGKCPKLEKQK